MEVIQTKIANVLVLKPKKNINDRGFPDKDVFLKIGPLCF